jgi:hypothetical protein
MIIGYFDVICIAVLKTKTDPPLIIDRNGVLPFSIVFQRMQSIAGWHLQVLKIGRQVYILQPAHGPPLQISGYAL